MRGRSPTGKDFRDRRRRRSARGLPFSGTSIPIPIPARRIECPPKHTDPLRRHAAPPLLPARHHARMRQLSPSWVPRTNHRPTLPRRATSQRRRGDRRHGASTCRPERVRRKTRERGRPPAMASDGSVGAGRVVGGVHAQGTPLHRLLDISAEQWVVDGLGLARARLCAGCAANLSGRDERPRNCQGRVTAGLG